MSLLLCALVAALVLSASASELSASAGEAPKAGVYSAEGAAIVGRSVKRFHNRPLYCNKVPGIVLAGDLPHIRFVHEPYVCGCLMMAVNRGGKAKWLHDFASVVSRYHDAHVTWEASDPSLPGLAVVLDVLPMAEGPGFCARLAVKGAKPGDRLIWAYGGATKRPPGGSGGTVAAPLDPMIIPDLVKRGFVPDDCRGDEVSINGDGFLVSPPHAAGKAARRTIAGRCGQASSALIVADAKAWADPAALTAASEKPEMPIAIGVTPLSVGKSEMFWAVRSFEGEKVDDSSIRQPGAAFEAGMRRAEAVGRQVVVDTPDKRFDASIAAACALTEGLIRPPQIMHGGMSWNMPYMGWRTMYGPTALGWHDIVKQAAALYINTQEKTDTKKVAHADPGVGYTAEAMNSRFYGLGHLNHGDQWRYDMQSMLYDMVIHAWRWTGDPELEKLLRDSLDLHLQWMKDCFDPDGDGVYESYQNVAEVDQVWYNGGGTAEETAYAYNGHLAAMQLARMAGNAEALSLHEKEAAKIRRGFMRSLWIPDKGYVGAYREQIGLKRLHEDSWLYSIFMPIDAGMLVDREPAQALHYTEWGLERVKMPLGGERCWTSNWIPTTWSSRMLWSAHAYSLGLAYCQAGLADDAWEMMKGGFVESCFNTVTPGGFECEGVGMDFHDVSSMFARAAVEGTFGYVPDYPSGVVRCAPRFPSKWDHASIKTPDFSLTFKRGDGADDYALKLTKAADIAFSVPVRARKLVSVEVDGKPAEWESASGYGHSMVSVKLPKRDSAGLSVKWVEALPQCEPVAIQGTVGQPIKLAATNGTIVKLEDPQRVLSNAKVGDAAATAVLTGNAGHHLVAALVDVGGLKQWQLFKMTVSDPKGEAEAAAKSVDKIPGDAKWACLDMKGSFNGDIRTIYKQEYLSPRPQTCSVRVGSNGYHSWAWYFWGAKAPPIDLSNVSKMLDASGRLVTPQGVQFAWGSEDRNIAFTSQWDNWPQNVTIPVGKKGKAVWLLVCGSTSQMQGKIANAEISLKYADGTTDKLEIVPPFNFWSLCGLPDGKDYDTKRDAFALAKTLPATVQLGANCRAIVLNRRLRDGATLESVTLETLSQEVVIGFMGVSVME